MNSQSGQGRKVYFDDTCDLCSYIAAMLVSKGDVSLIGLSRSLLPPHTSREDALMEVHAVDERGAAYKGIDAIIQILSWHPRWKWLSPIVASPGIKQCTRFLYHVIARHRYRLGIKAG